MTAELSRTSTNSSEDKMKADDENALTAVISTSSTSSAVRPSATKSTGRTPSHHSLLGSSNGTERKSGHARMSHTHALVERVSISMPPPATKLSHDRRLSINKPSRRSEDNPIAVSPPSSIKSSGDKPSIASATVSTTATDTTSVTTSSAPQSLGLPVSSAPALTPNDLPNQLNVVPNAFQSSQTDGIVKAPARTDSAASNRSALPSRGPRTPAPRSLSSEQNRPVVSAINNEGTETQPKLPYYGIIGVCALDIKARSRPSRSILTRLQENGEFDVIVFGDKVILDEAVENWPICDFLISFFSDGFPLDKAIAYVKLRKPFVVNDLQMQKVLWDRRICLQILDNMGVPTPKRIEVNRDGGPKLESPELAQHVMKLNKVRLEGPDDGTGGGAKLTRTVEMTDDGDTLIVDGQPFKKPFVEKPISGEDHNVIIYFPKSHEGGGARRLFRKIGNKSSEFDPNLVTPRCITEENSSYIYEQFLQVDNAEDVKAYTVGAGYCHAETRKSPVVDGLVKRNTHGKELRYVTKLNKEEASMAAAVANGFGQRICGFDLLRAGTKSYVIDVNGWSFVKDNNDYYDKCADILKVMFSTAKFRPEDSVDDNSSEIAVESGRSKTNTVQGHRSALKTILKSPSMSRLAGHIAHPHTHSHGRHHRVTSPPSMPGMTIPMSSPPSVENSVNNMVSSPIDVSNVIPPPIVTTTNNTGVLTTDSPSEEVVEEPAPPLPNAKHSWKLKGMVSVIRHADRTPKQKIKFTAHSQVFADLLKGHHEEVLLKGEAALASVEAAVKTALQDKLEDPEKLKNLRNALAKKGSQPGTKVQIKPMFRKRKPEEMTAEDPKTPTVSQPSEAPIPENEEIQLTESPVQEKSSPTEVKRITTRSDSISGVTFSRFSAAENDLVLDKLQLVMKWGGEPTHSARYQSQELGTNMRDDLKLLNREVLNDVRVFSSSEKRVRTSAEIFASAFLKQQNLPEDYITIRKDLLDDSNAAKDVMDKVKKKLKHLLREGNSIPEQFAWPKNTPEPSIVMMNVVELLKFHRRVMRHNFKKLSGNAVASLTALNGGDAKDNKPSPKDQVTVSSIQARWCTGEDPELFKERWEKMFAEFCDTEKADPSKVSELYDTMKYDALHNKAFLEWIFTPSQSIIDEIEKEQASLSSNASPEPERVDVDPSQSSNFNRHESVSTLSSLSDKHTFAQKIGLRRKSVLAQPPSTPPLIPYEQDGSYFKLYGGSGDSRSKVDKRLSRLRELYRYAKILFDYVSPQEYGISDNEKLEIGLLTSLPLLREIVQDLEELQASGDAKSFLYFTKESHIYTLLNCIMEGGIHTKIKRAAIPELDYLSQICFELYEAYDADTEKFTYSIRISISPGCHTVDPLDVSLDSKHAIGSAPRRSLTNHQDWLEVIETLKQRFGEVELPKSFLAVNVSEKHAEEAEAVNKANIEKAGVEGNKEGDGGETQSVDG